MENLIKDSEMWFVDSSVTEPRRDAVVHRARNRCGDCRFCPEGSFCKTAKHAVTKLTVADNCRHFLLPQKVYDAISFRDVWKLPLHMDDYTYAWSSEDVMALTFDDYNTAKEFNKMRKLAEKVVKCINGDAESDTKGRWTHQLCDFYLDGKFVFCVRGWGHLTGTGAMSLPTEEAERIQDEFIDFIMEKINGTGK